MELQEEPLWNRVVAKVVIFDETPIAGHHFLSRPFGLQRRPTAVIHIPDTHVHHYDLLDRARIEGPIGNRSEGHLCCCAHMLSRGDCGCPNLLQNWGSRK